MRRRLAILLVAAFILTGVALPTPVTRPTVAQDSSGDWPMFRGNAARTGSGAGIGAQDAKLRWEFETAGEIYSSPAIADNVIYFGSQDRNFYAVDVLTGLELWKIAIGDTGPYIPHL